MSQKYRIIIFLVIILSFRFYFHFTAPKPYEDGDTIRITANVLTEPINYQTSQYLKLKGLKVYLPRYPVIYYGDIIVVEGKVQADKLLSPKLIKLDASKNIIYGFRKKLLDFYKRSVPQPHSSLVAGMAIGAKSGIPQKFWERLKNSGTAHVVVASGMNVSLIAGFLIGFFTLFFKRQKALVLTFFGIWFYAVLSGFEAPIIRSAIMGSIAFAAQGTGRINSGLKALFMSALIMLFINPSFLGDVGFLLSFFATLGLILFEKKIKDHLAFVPNIIKEDLSTTLSAQIGVFPILIFSFGKFNILSPLANVLVLWTVVPITLIGMLGSLIGLIVPMVGRGILLLSYPLTSYFVLIVSFFG